MRVLIVVVVVVVTGGKQSQLLVLGLRLEFDNYRPVVLFLHTDFGEGCSSSCCCSCDRGKTKSTPSPFDLSWNGLRLEFDNYHSP